MISRNLKNRLAALEAISWPVEIGVIREEDEGKGIIEVGGVKVTMEEFTNLYPNGMILRIVREDRKPDDADL